MWVVEVNAYIVTVSKMTTIGKAETHDTILRLNESSKSCKAGGESQLVVFDPYIVETNFAVCRANRDQQCPVL